MMGLQEEYGNMAREQVRSNPLAALCEGQYATVLQLPAIPLPEGEAKESVPEQADRTAELTI